MNNLELIKGYQELVHLDSSLIHLELLRYLEVDEIINITIGMVRKDIAGTIYNFEKCCIICKICKFICLTNKWTENSMTKMVSSRGEVETVITNPCLKSQKMNKKMDEIN